MKKFQEDAAGGEKVMRGTFQSLVNTAKIVGEGAIYGVVIAANRLNAEHGYRYLSYIDEIYEVLRMKTSPRGNAEWVSNGNIGGSGANAERGSGICDNKKVRPGNNWPSLPSVLDTQKARKCFGKAIEKGWLRVENGKFTWVGFGATAHKSQLAYFCGRVYGYKHSAYGNCGAGLPEAELVELFGVKRLRSLLTQVHNAQKERSWRTCIDELFE